MPKRPYIKPAFWDVREELLSRITAAGGWVNCHAHIDRAYTITQENFPISNDELDKKWVHNAELRRSSTVDEIYGRMAQAVERMLEQDVSVLASFIDVDCDVQDKAIRAAQRIREKYADDLTLLFLNQSSYGIFNEEKQCRYWFDTAVQFVDIIGGLPKADGGREAEHLDVLMETAKKYNKPLHVHVDQLNTPDERESELLARKTIEHGLQGKVTGIHAISIGAHPIATRTEMYRLFQEAQLSFVSCPVTWLNERKSEQYAPIHNPITPADELLEYAIPVGIGSDNIADIFMPFNNADMWLDLRVLLEAARIHDLDELTNIATSYGRKLLGLPVLQKESA